MHEPTRTVTVPTRDHGRVTLAEPAWCLGQHTAGGYRVDIFHEGPETVLSVPTSRGTVPLLLASLEQRPYTDRPPGTGLFLNVGIGADWYPSNPEQLEQLAAALEASAEQLRALGHQLTARLAGGAS